MESYKPSLSYRMATAPKAKYGLEILSIAFLLMKGEKEGALKFMREMRVPERMWWTVSIAGILRWCIHRDSEANIKSALHYKDRSYTQRKRAI